MFGNKLDLQISKLYCITHKCRISKNDHRKSPCLRYPLSSGPTKTLQKSALHKTYPPSHQSQKNSLTHKIHTETSELS